MNDEPTAQPAAEPESFEQFEAKSKAPEAQPEAKVEPAKEPLELGGTDAPKATDDDVAAEEKKRGRPWSHRVDILTAKLREAERERDELRAGQGKAPAAVAPTLDEVTAKEPKPEDFDFGAADPDYLEARQDWKLDVRDAKARDESGKAAEANKQTEAQREVVGKLETGMAAIEKAGPEKYEDFETKINEAIEARGGEPLHPMVSIGIAVSPAGADIAYRLATDEAVAEKIEKLAQSNPRAAAMEFGELEGQYLDNEDDADLDLNDPLDMARMIGRERARRKGLAKGAAVERKVTKAPEPAEHRSRGATGQFETRPDTPDFGAFEKMANRAK